MRPSCRRLKLLHNLFLHLPTALYQSSSYEKQELGCILSINLKRGASGKTRSPLLPMHAKLQMAKHPPSHATLYSLSESLYIAGLEQGPETVQALNRLNISPGCWGPYILHLSSRTISSKQSRAKQSKAKSKLPSTTANSQQPPPTHKNATLSPPLRHTMALALAHSTSPHPEHPPSRSHRPRRPPTTSFLRPRRPQRGNPPRRKHHHPQPSRATTTSTSTNTITSTSTNTNPIPHQSHQRVHHRRHRLHAASPTLPNQSRRQFASRILQPRPSTSGHLCRQPCDAQRQRGYP